MAKQLITIGTPGSGGGDPAHVAFKKFNDNATELYDAAIPDTEEKKTQARVNLGLGTAATKNVGTAAGNVMEVGGFGIGSFLQPTPSVNTHKTLPTGFYGANNLGFPFTYGHMLLLQQNNWTHRLFFPANYSAPSISSSINLDDFKQFNAFLVMNRNATADANGFIKAASPIIKLFAYNIELNDEAQQQGIAFEKLGIGDYLIKESSGFAQEGWYIETPKDANGNVLFSVIYNTLENGDISIKTYKKKFDLETASIIADLNNAVDITEGRWIDLRLQEIPQPEVQISESNTPPDFQPTNLAQAVAEALNNGTEQ